MLFLIDISGATDISALASLPGTGAPADVKPVSKMPFLDLLAPAYGLAGPTFPEKIEGIAFGPDQPDGSHLLVVTQDNDFVAGQPSRIFAFSIAPTALTGWQAASASFSDACLSPAPVTCPSADACRHDGMCNPGTASCRPPALPAGTIAGPEVLGDCLRNQCDGQGSLVSIADDNDVPADDGNQCTTEVCGGGTPSHPATAAGTTCDQGGGAKCDGAGFCVACLAASDCPGTDTDCAFRSCIAGTCTVLFAPRGVAVSSQTAGDCQQNQCDGSGGVTTAVDDSDVPVDGNPCTDDVCIGGVGTNPPVPAVGFTCGGGNVCDGAGLCIGCITAKRLPWRGRGMRHARAPPGFAAERSRREGTRVTSQIAGDCHANACDRAGNIVSVVDDTDVLADGNDCTIDVCTDGVPSNAVAPVGSRCSQSGGNVCSASGRCVAAFMVVRMGDGATPLSSASAPVFVDEYTIDGSLLRTVALPTTINGSQRRFTNSGQASSEGALALSSDGHYLTLAGYDASVAPPTASVAGTAAATTNRVVARIDAAGNVDTSTSVNNAFDKNNVRGAVTDDGTRFWLSGANGGASGGVQFVALGGTAGSSITSNLSNVRTLEIFGGQLYGGSNNGTFTNVFTVGIGLPTTPATAVRFQVFLRRPRAHSPSSSSARTRSRRRRPSDATAGGGIQKWTLNGATWTLATTFSAGLGGVGARGLAGYVSGSNVVLIATTAESANPSGQHVVTLTDPESPTAANIVTGSTSIAYRGVALPPF
jgi:hypothetical protein